MVIKTIQDLVVERAGLYQFWQFFWFSVHYSAGLVAILAGGLATAASANESPAWVKKYAWGWGLTASLLAGVVTFLGPLQKAESYKQVQYVLEKAIVDSRQQRITDEELSDLLGQSQQTLFVDSSRVHLSALPNGDSKKHKINFK